MASWSGCSSEITRHPTFIVLYGEHRARIAIATGEVINGQLPPRAIRLVQEWATMHRAELEANWERAEQMQLPEQIEPLE